MSSVNYINKLIKLKGFLVEKINNKNDKIEIHGKMNLKEQTCPCCGHKTIKVHDYRKQKIKDLKAFDKNVLIIINKRRYVCTHCNKRFIKKIPFLAKYQRKTKRLTYSVINKLKNVQSYTSISKELDLSVSTIIRIFDSINYIKPQLPEAIGIDEFKGNTGTDKYQCIITDLTNNKVLDILPNRYEYSLIDYFKSLDRSKTKYFVSDMWTTYSNIAKTYFKNSIYVIDKYHFVRQVSWAFESVRKEVQKKFIKNRRIYVKHSRKLLLKRYKTLNKDDRQAVMVILNYDNNLYNAYLLKEDFYDLMESKNKDEAKRRISNWILRAENSKLDRFVKCANTLRNWITGISKIHLIVRILMVLPKVVIIK